MPQLPNLFDAIVDDANVQSVNLLRVEASLRNDVVELLGELERDIIAKLERIVGKNDLNAQRLKVLLAQVRDTIHKYYLDARDANIESLGKIAQASAMQVVATVNGAVGVDLLSLQMTASQLRNMAQNTFVMGNYLREWWAKQGEEVYTRFQTQMRLGMLQGEGVNELVQRVRGTRANNYTDALMRIPTYQAEALVRTGTVSLANAGRLQTYVDNADVLNGIQWLATLDDRVCDVCMALDGCMWALPEGDDAQSYGDYESLSGDKEFPGTTAHVGCRCTQVPVVKSYKELLGQDAIDESDVDKEMRASMDGQTSETNFDDWLRGKSDTFQDELLGADKAEAFRAGKIDLADLTDQSNRPLSADELLGRKGATDATLSSKITSKRVLGGGMSESFICEFENGEYGVFKPISGEDPKMRDLGPANAYREAANSDVSMMVGMDDLVPHAIVRDVDKETGSMQAFVKGASEGGSTSLTESPRAQVMRAAAWDYFVGNTDRHGGNWMTLDAPPHDIRLIDNGLTWPGVGNTRMFHSRFFDYANNKNWTIPSDVTQWMAKWDDIKTYLQQNDFTPTQISSAYWRLQQLASAKRFSDLPPAFEYLWNTANEANR